MHVWLPLLAREALLLLILAASGSGLVSLLPARVDGASRLVLAPAFGLALLLCVLMSVAWRLPADHGGAWVMVLVAVASLGVAFARAGWSIRRLVLGMDPVSTIQLVAVMVTVLVFVNLPLVQRDTLGPVGYKIADSSGYVIQTDGLESQSIYAAARQRPPWPDLTIQYAGGMAAGDQEVGFTAVQADLNELTGQGATQTNSAFVIGLLLVGALGAFGVIRVATHSRSWGTVAAAVLFAGPFYIQLFMDGSQGAISGLVLVLPLLLVMWLAVEERRLVNFALVALLAAGLQTAYPLFVPPIVIAAAIVLAALAIRRHRRARIKPGEALGAVLAIVGTLVLSAVFTPVAFARNVRYWTSILEGHQSFPGLSIYEFPTSALPAWLFQTRGFYELPALGALTLGEVLTTMLLPIVLVAVVAYGLRRQPFAVAILVLAGVAAALAYETAVKQGCPYCEDRNLLIVSPVLIGAVGIGLAALAAAWRGRASLLAFGAAAIALVVVAGQALAQDRRVERGTYLLDRQTVQAIAAVPRMGSGRLQLEGFGQDPSHAPMEEPEVYNAAREALGAAPSIVGETDDYRGLLYMDGPRPVGPEFDPGYRYVLTRLGGVTTARRTIAHYGPIAVQERVGALDALVAGGVAVGAVSSEPRGFAWVEQAPVTIWVTGAAPRQATWAQLDFQVTTPGPVVVGQAGPSPNVSRRRRSLLQVCLTVPGSGALRRGAVPIAVTPVPPPPPREEFEVPLPPQGLRLTAVYALDHVCWR